MNPLEHYLKKSVIPTSISQAHLLLAIYFIQQEGPLGRYELQKKLGLGDSTTRTLLKYLKKIELIQSKQKRGHLLTDKGIKILTAMRKTIIDFYEVHFPEFAFGKTQVLVHLRDIESKITNGIQERDNAIIAGARGAVTLEAHEDELVMPGIEKDDAQDYSAVRKKIKDLVKLEPSDVLVICSADSLPKAFIGCSAIALSIGWKA
ncbi:MAG: DUF4443 domain-containing protein [Candidatus Ranarchaeia archaeon]|jgi:predicted transcriptional regulator